MKKSTFPLHPAQTDIFTHQLMNKESSQYNIGGYIRLKGTLDKEKFRETINSAAKVFDVFKIRLDFDSPKQGYFFDNDYEIFELEELDLSDQINPEEEAKRWMQNKFDEPFVFEKQTLLFENVLIKVAPDEHWLFLKCHHLICDGYGYMVWIEYIAKKYKSLISGEYCDFNYPKYHEEAVKAFEYKNSAAYEAEGNYWNNRIDKKPKKLFQRKYQDKNRSAKKSSTYVLSLSEEQRKLIEEIQRVTKSGLPQLTIAALLIYFGKTSDQSELVFATPIHKRGSKRLRSIVGMFSGIMPYKGNFKKDLTLIDLLKEITSTQKKDYRNQNYLIGDLSRDLKINPSEGYLYEIAINYEPFKFQLAFGDEIQADIFQLENDYERNPLTLCWQDFGNQQPLQLHIHFWNEYFSRKEIELFTHRVIFILERFPDKFDNSIGSFTVLPVLETLLLDQFNATQSAYPKDKCIVEVFEEQVLKTPTNTALVFEQEELNYYDLNERSNRLAHYLRKKGVKEETLVPVCIGRSIELIVAILGILKAGGAYVPVDAAYPVERIRYMLVDTGARIVVSDTAGRSKLQDTADIDIIVIDEQWTLMSTQPSDNLQIPVAPYHLAYVIYTSGSTGRPKGVLVEHGNVVSLIRGVDYVCLGKEDILLSTGSPSFDATTFEYWSMLLNGGQLVLCTENRLLDSELLKEEIETRKVNKMWFTSSWFNRLVESDISVFEGLQTLLVGGEKLSESHIRKIRQTYPAIEIINGYGPTENTTFSLTYKITDTEISCPIAIGRPLSNRSAYILNQDGELMPIGVAGEICVGGAGLSRGYLNNSDLTAERFIKDPFSKEEGGRLYRTGDIGRWLPDGNIEYLGRRDNQVKIRGYRIELGEIESVLQQCELVRHGAVLAREDKEGSKKLVGYVVAEGAFDKEAITSYLHERLSEYMIPTLLIEMENLPLTSNGKVDRKSLPDPNVSEVLSGGYVAPRNQTETRLAEIWQEVLEVDQVGIHDDFFELGGDSLLAIRIISAIRKKLKVELPINCVFEYPTIAGTSAHLKARDKGSLLPAIEVADPRPERIPLSFSQERLWFIDQLEGSVQYHVPAVLGLGGRLNKEALAAALAGVVSRHEVLRTVFLDHEGESYQYIKDKDKWELNIIDGYGYKQDEKGLQRYIERIVKEPFDLSKDYMLRAHLISIREEEHVLVVVIHHIASDGWSRSVLVRELVELYRAYEQGLEAELPQLPIQYADYAVWQRKYLQQEVLEMKLGYWKEKLQGVAMLELPTDYARPATVSNRRGAWKNFSIEKELSEQLQDLSRQQGSTLFMTLLAAFKVLLFRYSDQEDICVGTPIAGRQQQEVEGLIGFFLNTLALRDQVRGAASFLELLQQVRATTLEAYEHQEVPFEKVVETVVKQRDSGRNPVFQVLFVLQNTPDVPELRFGEVTLSAKGYDHPTAMFDITFYITETEHGLDCSVEYSTELYCNDTIDRMTDHYRQLLDSIVKSPGERIGELQILGKGEEQRLLVEFNGRKAEYPKDKTIVNLFEEQVLKTPEGVAAVCGQQELTYKELNEQCNRLARYLRSQGVKEESLVAICMERSLKMIVGILAILKAGGTYVPIEPEYPVERIRCMLEDSRSAVLLTNKAMGRRLESGGVELVFAEDVGMELLSGNLGLEISPQSVVCIIYTSGSTGKPKGVRLQNDGIVNRMYWMWKNYPFEADEKVALKTSIGFVDHIWELFGALTRGVRSVLFTREDLLDLDILPGKLSAEKITRWVVVPSLLRALLDRLQGECRSLEHLKYWTCSGEALDGDVPEDFYKVFPASSHRLLNIYGSSEVTADVTCYDTVEYIKKDKRTGGKVAIGRPISNCQVYILDKRGKVVPQGVGGEIYIGGVQVAAGYLNSDETAERFIKDPFNEEEGSRLYRTGDMARWLADGNIEYLGRKDDQVKIRGHRIELGEVEAVLRQSEIVKDAVVLVKEDQQGNKRLVGYIVAEGAFDKETIGSYLQERLPEYMVPSLWAELKELPLTSNGKVDKKALPDFNSTELFIHQYVPPQSEEEKALSEIWQELLKIEHIGIKDNFFELGGHSMIVLQIVNRVRKLGYEIQAKDLFKYQTIEQQSKFISTSLKLIEAAREGRYVIPIQPGGSNIPFFAIPEFLLYSKIGSHVSKDQSFYAIERSPYKKVEDVVSHYITEIKKIYPHGPYCLAGYCQWGQVAVEMAHTLVEQGEDVPLLVLIEYYSPKTLKSRTSFTFLRSKIKHTYNRLKCNSSLISKGKIITKEVFYAFHYIFRKHFLVSKNKKQKNNLYHGKVVLIQASESYGHMEDYYMGWSEKFTGEVEKFIIEGEHLGIFFEPGASKIAEKLNPVLEEINRCYKGRC